MADQTEQTKPQGAADDTAEKKPSNKRFIAIIVVVLLVIGGGLYYWHSSKFEDTDDAQVDGDLYQVSSRVTGHVVKVYVEDNQQVQTGQLLVEIDRKSVV